MPDVFKIRIPRAAGHIIARLNERGYEAYVVGGCVRDSLLGRIPGDWDITTSARPEEVKGLFPFTVDTGIQHGTVTVIMGRVGYEVTTYRIDGAYLDGRHPERVVFASDLAEDLRRRDFTINAMAYSRDSGLVDLYGGMEDLKRRLIRCVGSPIERFSEDALRILRAIRFSAQLGFDVEKETRAAIEKIAPNIAKVSKERIQAELTKILLSPYPEKMREVFETGIAAYISREFSEIPWGKMEIPNTLPAVKYVRWAAFLRLVPADSAVRILRGLKFDNDTIGKTDILVRWSGRTPEESAPAVRRALSQMPPEVWDALAELNQYPAGIRALAGEIRSAGDCLSLKDLAVRGQDLIAVGMKPGREMGECLNRMLEEAIEHPEHNEKMFLIEKYAKGQ